MGGQCRERQVYQDIQEQVTSAPSDPDTKPAAAPRSASGAGIKEGGVEERGTIATESERETVVPKEEKMAEKVKMVSKEASRQEAAKGETASRDSEEEPPAAEGESKSTAPNEEKEVFEKPEEAKEKPEEVKEKPGKEERPGVGKSKPEGDKVKPDEDKNKPEEDKNKPEEDKERPDEGKVKPEDDKEKPEEGEEKPEETQEFQEQPQDASEVHVKTKKYEDISDTEETVKGRVKTPNENGAESQSAIEAEPPHPHLLGGEAMEVEVAGQEHDTSAEFGVGDESAALSMDTRDSVQRARDFTRILELRRTSHMPNMLYSPPKQGKASGRLLVDFVPLSAQFCMSGCKSGSGEV